MNAREQRGLVIAATANITKAQRGACYVPSQSKSGTKYRVEPNFPRCDCPDFQEMGLTCKHLFAVQFVIERERNKDGTTTVTETLTVTETVQKKKTYKQVWPAYNAAQSVEKDRVQELLADLWRGVPEPERKPGRGRPGHSIRDSIFAMVYKVYGTFSARRFSSDLREAHERGYLSRDIPGLKVPQFFENKELTPILKNLVRESSLPLRAVESAFAIDSSGFGSSRYESWYDHRYGGKTTRRVVWVKCHLACGTKTNCVTAARILDKDSADSPQFTPLVKETSEGFTIGEVSADKAYSSYENFETVAGCGGEGFLAFRLGTTAAGGGTFQKMYHYFQYRQEEFLQHYHRRSNVESVFSAVKRKFGADVRSKTDDAMVNEVFCKLIAHNLCVVVQEMHELGIAGEFWKDAPGEAVLKFPGV